MERTGHVRTAWGTTRPTKPMMPQVATLAAVSSAVHPYTRRRVRSTPRRGGARLLAQGEEVEITGAPDEDAQRAAPRRPRRPPGLPGGAAEAAEQPEKGVADGRRVGEHDDGAHERPGERADHDAREQEHPRVESAARDQGQTGTPRRWRHGAEKGGDRDRPGLRPSRSRGRARRRARAARQTQQVRLGQGIPDHGLERCADRRRGCRRPGRRAARAAPAARERWWRRRDRAEEPRQTSPGASGTAPARGRHQETRRRSRERDRPGASSPAARTEPFGELANRGRGAWSRPVELRSGDPQESPVPHRAAPPAIRVAART
jgi:hypothetical protein